MNADRKRKHLLIDYISGKCKWRLSDYAEPNLIIAEYGYYDLDQVIHDIQKNYPDVKSIRINFKH